MNGQIILPTIAVVVVVVVVVVVDYRTSINIYYKESVLMARKLSYTLKHTIQSFFFKY